MNINYSTWFGQRHLNFCPKHFIKTKTLVTNESHLWIIEKLHGRYYIDQTEKFDLRILLDDIETGYPCFEDPQEAMLYELRWS